MLTLSTPQKNVQNGVMGSVVTASLSVPTSADIKLLSGDRWVEGVGNFRVQMAVGKQH